MAAPIFGWSIARVDGDSMAPTLLDGDYVLACRCREPVVGGAVVLVRHPTFGPIVKRIRARDADGRYRVAGDNPLSIPGDTIGALDGSALQALVHWRVSPRGVQRVRPAAPTAHSGMPK